MIRAIRAALTLPVIVLSLDLTVVYHYLRNGRVFDLLPVTVVPAALDILTAARADTKVSTDTIV